MENIDLLMMLDERLIDFDLEVKDKDDAIYKVSEMLFKAGVVSNFTTFIEAIYQRENEMTTGIGMGIAIPHCQNQTVNRGAFTLVHLKNEIEWGSLDNQPVTYIIMLAAPINKDNLHLKMLSTLAKNLMDDTFRQGLLKASSIEEIKDVFNKKKGT